MRSSFGPWASAVDVGSNVRLNAFWKRRLAMLHVTSQSRRSLTRRVALWLVAVGILACALPTLRVFSAPENKEAEEQGEPVSSGAGAKRTVPKEKLRYAERSFDEWKRVLATDLDPETRKKAIQALGAFGVNGYGEEAVEEIVQALKRDGSKTVADAASSALGRIGAPAVPVLARLLKHERPLVRSSAAGAFLRFYTPAKAKSAVPAIPALVGATRDEDASVREYACSALDTIMRTAQTPQSVKLAVPALSKALKDDDETVRVSAAGALGTIGPKAAPAVPALIEAIRAWLSRRRDRGRDRRHDETLRYAIEALGDIGPAAKAAIPVLTEVMDSPFYPYQRTKGPAAEALEKIQAKPPSPPEEEATEKPSP